MAKNNETNDYSVEELMAMIKAKTTEEERKKITKELTKKEPVVEYYKHEKHHNYYVEEEKDEDGNILIEGEKFYKLTDLDEFKKVVKRDLDKYLDRMFYDEEYNYFKEDEIVKKTTTTESKIRKSDEYDDIHHNPTGKRCKAMVWAGGKGGRCKHNSVCSRGLCKTHTKATTLSWGHYDIDGAGSVPDKTAHKLTINPDKPIDFKPENYDKILLLAPVNITILNLHIKIKKITNRNDLMLYFNTLNICKTFTNDFMKIPENDIDYYEEENEEMPEIKNEIIKLKTEEKPKKKRNIKVKKTVVKSDE